MRNGPRFVPRKARQAIGLRYTLLAAAILLGVWRAHAQGSQPAQKNQPLQYVGSEVCQACHEDIYKAFAANPHHLVEKNKKYNHVNNACESCHGPGSKHTETLSAADIQQPAKLPATRTDRICLSCHQNQSTHVGRLTSSHAKNQVSCTVCHKIHGTPEELVPRLGPDVNEQCSACHIDIWASFQRQYRHRLPEGVMSCVDCHNPHGSVLPYGMLQTFRGNEPGCFNCHGDLAAPFVYEHAPVRLEGCMACHQPHGSANPRMLTRAQVQYVCLECHANPPVLPPNANAFGPLGTVPPSFHDLRSPRFQNCTTCHQKIHGSYVNPELLR